MASYPADTPTRHAAQRAARRTTAVSLARLAGIALLPALVNALLSVHYFTAPARDSIPYYSDELAYWNQIATFREAGLYGGFTTVNERAAPVEWSRFGPHGPVFPMTYGSVALITGWKPSTPVDVNLGLVTAAAIAWLATARPPLIAAALLLGTYWPLALALTTTMQEPLHYALVLLMAAAVSRVVRRPTVSFTVAAFFAVVVTIASLLRPTWALLFVPCFADRATGSTAIRWTARAAGLLATAALSAIFFFQLTAPYPGSPVGTAMGAAPNAVAAAASITARMIGNLGRFFSWANSAPLEILFRYEAVALLAGLTIAVARRGRATPDASRRLLTIAAWFLGLTLAAVVAGGNIESWRDYRVLTPALFLVLLLIIDARWQPARAVLAAHLLLLPLAASTFAQLYEPKFRADRTLVAAFGREISPFVRFEPGASGWRNTLLVPADHYQYPLLAVPHGIGVSAFSGWNDLSLPLKSRYVLLRPSDRESAPGSVHLRKLRDTVHGTLYETGDTRVLESRR